jgi:hypothetical protein
LGHMHSQWMHLDKRDLFNLARVVWWLVLTPISFFMGWLDKVVFVSLLSIWALVESAWGAFEASSAQTQINRIEEKLDQLLTGHEKTPSN